MPPKKLICDRCGEILDDRDAIELAIDGAESWREFVMKEKGREPRGLFPCKNWIRCQGEMIDWKDRDKRRGGNGD